MAIEFLPEHWNIIKSYAGIYHIRTDWDLSKLDNNLIQVILGMVSPYKANINNMRFMCINDRIKCIWQHLNKSKLRDIDNLIKHFCSRCITRQDRNCKCINKFNTNLI
jgi:hypothetical protein